LARWFIRAALVVCILSLAAVAVTRLSNRHYGNLTDGSTLYYTSRLQCFACHGTRVLAPLLEVGESRARERAAELHQPLALYLAESILYPDKYVVPLYTPGGMPHYQLALGCNTCLNQKELYDIVAYLMTLR
jgi:hypothetical protein